MDRNIQEKQENHGLFRYLCKKYIDKISWRDFWRTFQKQSQEVWTLSSLKAFISEDVFAVSLHQMTDRSINSVYVTEKRLMVKWTMNF